MRRPAEPVLEWVLLPAVLLALVLSLDLLIRAVPFHVLTGGLLDEPAHLATTALVLLAVPQLARSLRSTALVLLASVGIDVDHVPLYLGVPGVAGDGRPFTHSVATLAVLLLLSYWPRARAVCRCLALGVALHFLRDVGTGPGLPLLWPWSTSDVRLPYASYAVVLVLAAAVATLRRVNSSRAGASSRR